MLKKAKSPENRANRQWLRQNLLVLFASVIAISMLSISYALINTTLDVGGQATVEASDPIRVASVSLADPQPSCGFANYPPTWANASFNIDGTLPALNCTALFNITVRNDSANLVFIRQIVEDSFNNSANMEYEFSIAPNSLDAVLQPQSQLDFTVKFRYKSNLASLPAMTSFVAKFHLVFEQVTVPLLVVRGNSRNFEVFRGNTATPPSNLYGRLAAIDDLDGNITANIQRTCRNAAQQSVSCPTTWADLARGDYDITFNAANSLGVSAAPVTFHVSLWDFVKIASGNTHSLTLGSHGKIWVWGGGTAGALGLGSTANQTFPFPLTTLSDIVDIAADNQTSFAVGSNGSLYAWGHGTGYRLGTNSTSNQLTPFEIAPPAGKKYVAVSAMEETGMALTNTGDVYSWGSCHYGSCGGGNNTARRVPTIISGLPKIVKISAGRSNGGAIDASGNLWIWGSNFYGQLGVGASGSVSGNSHGSITGGSSGNVPQMWNNFTNAKDICYGWAHAVAIKNDGSVWVWGNNSSGRIGNGSASTNQYTPLQLGISGGRSCYANEEHSQVVTNGNALYAWGDNDYGEIGNKVTTNTTSPSLFTQVSDIDSSSIGRDSAHVIRNGITVYGWGRNNNGGSVGNGSTTNTTAAHAWDFTVPSMREW